MTSAVKRKISVIGIGAGDPDLLTVQAIKALNAADVVFLPDKGSEKSMLREMRLAICREFVVRPDQRHVGFGTPKRDAAGGYLEGVDRWHDAIGSVYATLFATELAEGETGAFLVWGDPGLFDSTLRILERLQQRGTDLEIDVIPGVSSVQMLAARQRIVPHGIGEPMVVMPARRFLMDGFPHACSIVAIVLEDGSSFAKIDAALMIHWGAYLGMDDEMLISGRLGDVRDEIVGRRRAAKARLGWIMDTYILCQPR